MRRSEPVTRARVDRVNHDRSGVARAGTSLAPCARVSATWTRPFARLVILLGVVTAACGRAQALRNVDVRDEPVTFQSGDVRLAGTLFVPGDGRRHPGIVLFHGSGPQGRDLFMARWFAEHGLAALAYDKRGVGESAGDFTKVPFPALTADGLAAIALLKRRSDVDPARIGVWGLSQGGWLGPLAASQSRDVAFVIAVSGPGVTPGEQMVFYYANDLRAQGFSAADVERASALRRLYWHALSTGDGEDAARHALERAQSQDWFRAVKAQADHAFDRSPEALFADRTLRQSPWYRDEVNYDPTSALRALRVPALFVFGDADTLVPVDQSVRVIRDTLTAAGQRAFSIVVVPGADHGLFVTGPDGRRRRADAYLDAMAAWLRETVR